MKRLIVTMILLLMAFSLSACSEQETGHQEQDRLERSEEQQTEEPSTESDVSVQTEEKDAEPHILIAYFTWAENTHVENPDEIDVDATTSASVLPPGNAAKLAGWIQEQTGGELFSIVVKEPYSSDYDECLDRAAEEEARDDRPELVNHVENMEKYDVIFLGFPNWWYTVPMAVHSFMEEYDFAGKTVIPFCTHGTGGLASTIQDIKKDLPDSTELREPIGVYRPDVDSAQESINEWLAGMGYEKKD